ncbi:MAG: DNA/RNA nuclease SfsA [Lachnospiraceae bacterium]|nr:DNA/RNA nuclease SfsA [Lachnospiraceae bacterium]
MQDEEAYTDFIAYFPDAPTERGIKHIRELIKAKKAGYHANRMLSDIIQQVKYVYPAVFVQEKEGGYSVYFRDLQGCYTCGDNLADAILMAEDVLALTLWDYETDKKDIPAPTDISKIKIKSGEFVNFICADTVEYAKKVSTRSVKKTLSIPEWLNTKAEEAGVNFSKVLQEALKEKLGVV